MDVQIWVGVEYLDQLDKNINSTITSLQSVFDNAVEYTQIAVLENQIQVGIKYNKYIELVDNGLLVEWSGFNQ